MIREKDDEIAYDAKDRVQLLDQHSNQVDTGICPQSPITYIEEDKYEYRDEPWRWVNLACLFAGCLVQNTLMIIFSPISTLISDAYDTPDSVISSNVTVFHIIVAILDLPSVFLLDYGKTHGYGMMVCFKISFALIMIGQWGRYMVLLYYPDEFWLTIFPSGCIALAQPFLLNGIGKLPCVWFGDNQRAIAIGILALSFILGQLFGLTLGTFFVHDKDKHDHEKIRSQLVNFMWVCSWVTMFCCLPMLIIYKQRPTIFPSKSARDEADSDKKRNIFSSLWTDVKSLITNKNFILVWFIFSFMNGTQVSLGAIINFLMGSFNFSTVETSILGATFVLSGFVATIIFPILIQKYRWFLRSLRIVVFGAFISSIFVLIALPTHNFTFSMITTGCLGIFLIPTLCIVYAFTTELTYPVSAPLFGCLLQFGTSGFGALFTYIGPYMINNLGPSYILITYVSFFTICCILSIFIKEDLRRINLSKSTGSSSNEEQTLKRSINKMNDI